MVDIYLAALNLVFLITFNLSRVDEKRSCIVVFVWFFIFIYFFFFLLFVFNSSFSYKIERRR